MNVKAKYQPVLDLGEELEVKNGDVTVEGDILKIKGMTKTQYEKNLLWDKIKEIGGEKPSDIKANITVEDDSVYARHSKFVKHCAIERSRDIFWLSTGLELTLRLKKAPFGRLLPLMEFY